MRAARPLSIRWFERIAYLSLVMSVATFMAAYRRMHAAAPDVADGRRGAVIVLLIVTLLVYLPLIRLAAHRASNLARWLLVVLLGIHLLGLTEISAIIAYGGASAIIALIQFPISMILIWLLFRTDSRKWFAGSRPVDSDVFS